MPNSLHKESYVASQAANFAQRTYAALWYKNSILNHDVTNVNDVILTKIIYENNKVHVFLSAPQAINLRLCYILNFWSYLKINSIYESGRSFTICLLSK